MKIVTAVVVGLITFSFAGVASAARCAPSAPKPHVAPTFSGITLAMLQSPYFVETIIAKMR